MRVRGEIKKQIPASGVALGFNSLDKACRTPRQTLNRRVTLQEKKASESPTCAATAPAQTAILVFQHGSRRTALSRQAERETWREMAEITFVGFFSPHAPQALFNLSHVIILLFFKSLL